MRGKFALLGDKGEVGDIFSVTYLNFFWPRVIFLVILTFQPPPPLPPRKVE